MRLAELARKERSLEDRARNLDARRRAEGARQEQVRELERVAGLSAGQARQILLRELEDELRHDSARLVRQVEEEARRDADRRARSILATVMQRHGGGPRRGDDGVGRRAAVGRPEGPHHRPRGPQHPRARDRDRRSTSSSTTRPER